MRCIKVLRSFMYRRITSLFDSIEVLRSVGAAVVVFLCCTGVSLQRTEVFAAEMHFINGTDEAGLSLQNSQSYGLCWADFDRDGHIDVLIKNHFRPPSLYHNLGNGAFEDITEQAGLNVPEDYHGSCFGDFDNDGDRDLYMMVGASGGTRTKTNFLYRCDEGGLFTNIASSAGVTDPEGRGRTPLWFDFDNDGDLDLFVSNAMRVDAPNTLFRNEGDSTFTNVTQIAGLGTNYARGAYVADLNADGYLDLLLSSGKEIKIYENCADGTFTETTEFSGLSGQKKAEELALGDYDNDGDVDIYICKHLDGDKFETSDDALYYQIYLMGGVESLDAGVLGTVGTELGCGCGACTFSSRPREVLTGAAQASVGPEKGFDIELDGSSVVELDCGYRQWDLRRQHVFIGADGYHPLTMPCSVDGALPENQGEPVRSSPGIYLWFDTGDNQWHLRAVASELSPLGGVLSTPGSIREAVPVGLEIDPRVVSNRLFANSGDGSFVDVTNAAGLGQEYGEAYSATFEDFDNDGDLDLYAVYNNPVLNAPNRLYENDGSGHFTNVAAQAGAEALVEGRADSIAAADYDNDGFVDIMVLNGLFDPAPFHEGPIVLLKNTTTGGNWMQIVLEGSSSNRDGVGASVQVEAGSMCLTRQQRGGVHRASQNSQVLHFGLGDETVVDRITIDWPSGIHQQLSEIPVNQRLAIREPEFSIDLIPTTNSIPRGDVLEFEVIARNFGSEQVSFVFSSNVTLPGGQLHPEPPDFLRGPVEVKLGPFKERHRTILHSIDMKAPIGEYVYHGYADGGESQSVDHFDISVTAE